MTEQEAIKQHIDECNHRIDVIRDFIQSNRYADKRKCDKNLFILKSVISALKEIQQYRALGTVEELREAREKQAPKKPITYPNTNRADCPVCGATVRGIRKLFGNFCDKCGQAIDWSEE